MNSVFHIFFAIFCALLTRQGTLAFVPPRHSYSSQPAIASRPSTSIVVLHAKHAQKEPAHHEKWQPYFDRLQQYRQEHGSFNGVEGDLKEWLQDQRKQYHLLQQGKKVRLTKKRAMALERAGAFQNSGEDAVSATP